MSSRLDRKCPARSKVSEIDVNVVVHGSRFILLQVRQSNLTVINLQPVNRQLALGSRLRSQGGEVPDAVWISNEFDAWTRQLDTVDHNLSAKERKQFWFHVQDVCLSEWPAGLKLRRFRYHSVIDAERKWEHGQAHFA